MISGNGLYQLYKENNLKLTFFSVYNPGGLISSLGSSIWMRGAPWRIDGSK